MSKHHQILDFVFTTSQFAEPEPVWHILCSTCSSEQSILHHNMYYGKKPQQIFLLFVKNRSTAFRACTVFLCVYSMAVCRSKDEVWAVQDEALQDNWCQLLQMCKSIVLFYCNILWLIAKGKAIPAQGAEGSRNWWLSDFKTLFT